MEELQRRPEKLSYISLLKFIAIAFIVLWHVVTLPNKPFDIGARMCEFLIVSSGFLVAYNYYFSGMPATFKQSFKYVYKHVRDFYPLHFLCLFLMFFLNFSNNISNFNLMSVENIFANLFLVQAWSPLESTAFSFNGVSWFLSALVFCYFLTPFFLKFLKSIKLSMISFLVVLTIRLGLEYIAKYRSSNIFNINFHYNPLIKALEFFLGLLIVPLFYKAKEKLNKISDKRTFKIGWTFIEIILPICIWLFMFYLSKHLVRGIFVLFFCFCVFIACFNYGYISEICKNKIVKKVFSYQMGVYLFQLVVDYSLEKVFRLFKWSYPNNFILEFLIIFVACVCAAAIYKEFLSKRLSFLFDKICSPLKKLFIY